MKMKILVYGYGNPGRQDDGLGPEFARRIQEWIEEEDYSNIETDSNYQLNIEDAEAISGKDIVIFVDASIEEIDSIDFTPVVASDATIEFTMHAVSSSFVLDLCKKIYNSHPTTWLLHIKGYEWDFREGLSEAAEKNLKLALTFIKEKLKNPELLLQNS